MTTAAATDAELRARVDRLFAFPTYRDRPAALPPAEPEPRPIGRADAAAGAAIVALAITAVVSPIVLGERLLTGLVIVVAALAGPIAVAAWRRW